MTEEELRTIKYAAAPTFKDIQALVAEVGRLKEQLTIATDALEGIIQQAEWGDDAAESALMIAEGALTKMSVVEKPDVG